ncbi:hypothetical protein MKX01_028231 [Papaver californicum]|nr:hypothetical protein MKX01_028231 [Papaver californicum]
MEMQQQGRRRTEDHLCGLWTNEKHVHFLNRMEDCFVRTMLDHHRHKNNQSNSHTHQLLPLDRFLPDGSDSTRDLRRHNKITAAITTTNKFSALIDADPDAATSATEEEQMTCLSLRPYDSSASSYKLAKNLNLTIALVVEEEKKKWQMQNQQIKIKVAPNPGLSFS